MGATFFHPSLLANNTIDKSNSPLFAAIFELYDGFNIPYPWVGGVAQAQFEELE